MITRLFLPLSVTVLAVGCSVLINVDGKQCSVDADCQALGGEFQGSVCQQSLCIAKHVEDMGAAGAGGAGGQSGQMDDPFICKAPTPSTLPTLKYSFAPLFASPPETPKPFSIKACNQLDLNCERPVFGPIDVSTGSPQEFEVPVGFTGYFEIHNPDTLDGLLFMGRPLQVDTVGWNVAMPSPEVVAQLAFATGEMVDPEKGLVLAVARDCNQVAVPGVTISSSKDGLQYYFVNSLPDTSLMKTGPQGAVGFANLEITTTILTGVHTSGKSFGPLSLRLKPHYISFGELFP
jgi:hypothetical protein